MTGSLKVEVSRMDTKNQIEDFHNFMRRGKTPLEQMLVQAIAMLSIESEEYWYHTPEEIWDEIRRRTYLVDEAGGEQDG